MLEVGLLGSIGSITGWASLIAFIAAASFYAYRESLRSKRKLIETADATDRARLVEQALEAFHVDTAALSPEDKRALLAERMHHQERMHARMCLLVAFAGLLLAGSFIASLFVQPVRNSETSGAESVGSETTHTTPSQSVIDSLEFVNEAGDETPGVIIPYPPSWYEVLEGIGPPQLLPKRGTTESDIGARIEIRIGSLSSEYIQRASGATFGLQEDYAALSSEQLLQFMRKWVEEIPADDGKGVRWFGQREVVLPVVSGASETPTGRAQDNGWILDFEKDGEHIRQVGYVQPSGLYNADTPRFGVLEVACMAPSSSFRLVSESCDKILAGISVVSLKYWDD